MDKWVRHLKNELQGTSNHPTAITEDQHKIIELEKTIIRIEMKEEILKKATALLMSDSMNNFR